MKVGRYRPLVVVGITLGPVLLALALLLLWARTEDSAARATMADSQPRLARLLGLQAADAVLDNRLTEARRAIVLLAHDADRDPGQIGNQLQQSVRSALQQAGMTVNSSRGLPVQAERKVQRVGVTAQVEGPLSGLQASLAALELIAPRPTIEGLTIQPTARTSADGSPVVAATITVVVLRLAS